MISDNMSAMQNKMKLAQLCFLSRDFFQEVSGRVLGMRSRQRKPHEVRQSEESVSAETFAPK